MKVIISSGFRYMGKDYPESARVQDIPKEVAAVGIRYGWATEPKAVKNKILKVKEVK